MMVECNLCRYRCMATWHSVTAPRCPQRIHWNFQLWNTPSKLIRHLLDPSIPSVKSESWLETSWTIENLVFISGNINR